MLFLKVPMLLAKPSFYPLLLLLLTLVLFKPNICFGGKKDALKIWVISDIQPRDRDQREEFRRAILDINKNVPDIDFVIVAGDIVDGAQEEDFNWYLSLKKLSYIKEWYEIAGNHDLKLNRGEGYREKIRKDLYYSITKGNILFLFMSDELRGKPTEISNKTFLWWKNQVTGNQDKIIVVVTHAPLEGSGIPFSSLHDRQILDSKRFVEVLKNYRVDLWFSGHIHLPHSFTNNIVKKGEYGGTVFVNASSIRTELLGLKPSESRIVTFYCDSNRVTIRSRNHSKEGFNKALDVEFRLPVKYDCN
ncbi:3',5'-cyclic adenosine monophosphate phosphodiesterase CpdA [bacterium HR37]|nr:3',5'-cyclic adenosine monophosphate phosphodiesterase CpdA [bacterium HR37]